MTQLGAIEALGIQNFSSRNLPTRVHRFRIEVRGSEANGLANRQHCVQTQAIA
jgi:hypothetical protein